MILAPQIPEKLGFLLEPCPYKVAYGGRGGGKSWAFARVLLTIGVSKPTRILCAREIQKSIKNSVHQLLKDQINKMGLERFYTVLETEVYLTIPQTRLSLTKALTFVGLRKRGTFRLTLGRF